MIEQIAADLSTRLRNTLPWVNEVLYIARQDPAGIILLEKPETYAGVNDQKPGRAYIRFREGWETAFTNGDLTSAPNLEVTSRLRLVYMHFYSNGLDLARFLANTLNSARSHTLRYGVTLRQGSTDKQFIVGQEANADKGIPDDRLQLVMIDFDVTYRDAVSLDPSCIPAGRVC